MCDRVFLKMILHSTQTGIKHTEVEAEEIESPYLERKCPYLERKYPYLETSGSGKVLL